MRAEIHIQNKNIVHVFVISITYLPYRYRLVIYRLSFLKYLLRRNPHSICIVRVKIADLWSNFPYAFRLIFSPRILGLLFKKIRNDINGVSKIRSRSFLENFDSRFDVRMSFSDATVQRSIEFFV